MKAFNEQLIQALATIGREMVVHYDGYSYAQVILKGQSGDPDTHIDYKHGGDEEKGQVIFLKSSFIAGKKTGQYAIERAVALALAYEKTELQANIERRERAKQWEEQAAFEKKVEALVTPEERDDVRISVIGKEIRVILKTEDQVKAAMMLDLLREHGFIIEKK